MTYRSWDYGVGLPGARGAAPLSESADFGFIRTSFIRTPADSSGDVPSPSPIACMRMGYRGASRHTVRAPFVRILAKVGSRQNRQAREFTTNRHGQNPGHNAGVRTAVGL